MDKIKIKDVDISESFSFCEGENIRIFVDKDKNEVYLSAPNLNKTTIKADGFVLSGDNIEIVAGRNISISTAHPNKITIGADFDKEKAKIFALEERIVNLEKAIALLLREKNGRN